MTQRLLTKLFLILFSNNNNNIYITMLFTFGEKMIKELTQKQEELITIYVNKWLDFSYRTKPVTQQEADDGVNFLYDLAEIEPPKYIVILDSPLECQYACNLMGGAKISAKIYDKISDKISAKIDANIYAKIRDKISDKISAKIYDKISDKISAKIDANIYANIYAKIRAKIYDKIYDNIYAKIRAKIYDKIYDKNLNYFYATRSNLWNSWYARLDYLFNEVIKDESLEGELLNKFLKLSAKLHYIYCLQDIAFVSEFPTEININDDGSLHDSDKAALVYKDGFSLYYSNGIEMPENFILTPANEITKEDYLAEENADVKREVIKKVGIERMLELLDAKVIDIMDTKHGGKYELLSVELSDTVYAKYLKMKCPSTGNIHILGVTNDANTALEGYRDLNNGLEPDNFIWEA